LYGGSVKDDINFLYPNKKYYVVYSKDDPALQIILPEYSTDQLLNPDTLSKDYLFKRMKCYLRTEAKEDWGWMWEDSFEVKEK
jgi:hypothetical protein